MSLPSSNGYGSQHFIVQQQQHQQHQQFPLRHQGKNGNGWNGGMVGTINNTPFRPTPGLDTIGKQQQRITLQTITAMSEYEQYSIEELRLHDMMTTKNAATAAAATAATTTATTTSTSTSSSTSISSSFTSVTKVSKAKKATLPKVDDVTSKISSFSISSMGRRKTGSTSSMATIASSASPSSVSSSSPSSTKASKVSGKSVAVSVGAPLGRVTSQSSTAAQAGTTAKQTTKHTKKYSKLEVAESKRRAYERYLRDKAKKEQKIANEMIKTSQPTSSVPQNGPGRCRPRTSDNSSTKIQSKKKPRVDGISVGKPAADQNRHHQSLSISTTTSSVASVRLKSPPKAAKTAPAVSNPPQPHQTIGTTASIPSVVHVQQQPIPLRNSSHNTSAAGIPSMMDTNTDDVVFPKTPASSAASFSSPKAQNQHDRDPNLDTPAGKATILLQAICKAAQNLPNSPSLNLQIVAEDSLWKMWEHLLTLQERLQKDRGRLYAVDIGFHYTSPEAIEKIKLTGLMTKSERQSTGIDPKIWHGNSYGDGIYTGNSCLSFQKYGSQFNGCCIIVARLIGEFRPRSKYFPDATDFLKYHTIIGNKDMENDPNGYYDEVVLRSRSQVVPLIYFNKAAIDIDNPLGISSTIDHDLSLVYNAAETLQRIISGICNQPDQKIKRIFYGEFINARRKILSQVSASTQTKIPTNQHQTNIPVQTQGVQVNLPP